ncbi:helix-turn-helix transcriptional regulator [uncultured Dokdonia sp.]|uniref:helix-turn-helix transcriptional regulator n=1 Tax=uncultured Dokdonia sp. TaxID=575653 RepID=UPI0026294458|nr:helix-turn-helix transcriptional regulator [uncultured Dokdonia sp.]
MSSILFSQERTLDSLATLDYKDIKKLIYKSENDSLICQTYIQAYLNKAKKENDSLEIARGYYFKIISTKEDEKFFHLYDTIIEISKKIEKQNFPAAAYFDKGVYYHRKYLYKNALNNYIKAAQYNHGSRKEHLNFLIDQSLGQLKSTIGKNQEALTITKKCYKYVIEKNYRDENSPLYYNVLFSLADAYRKMNYLDSARVYNRLGLLDKNESETSINYYHFLLLDGILKLEDKQYVEAEINISRALPHIEKVKDQTTIAKGYFYLGKTYSYLKNEEKSILNYKKVDSIVQKTNNIAPEFTNAYQQIIKYYEKKVNLEQQLKYTVKLIKVDSILDNRYKYVNQEIIDKFAIPNLINSKEQLIHQLQLDKKKSNTSSAILILMLSGIIGVTIFQYKKKIFYKKRFEELIHTDKPKETITSKISETSPPDIPKEILEPLLMKLSKFEASNSYTNSKITLNSLALKMQTNSNYLSKVINHYKQKSFVSYIKELRIEYAFNQLKTQPKLRRFTIKAIAEECGFKSAESFSKTFYKAYGIYPSYFIKKLNTLK